MVDKAKTLLQYSLQELKIRTGKHSPQNLVIHDWEQQSYLSGLKQLLPHA